MDAALRGSLKVTRYQSSKAKVAYADYVAAKAAGRPCRGDARDSEELAEEAATATAFA